MVSFPTVWCLSASLLRDANRYQPEAALVVGDGDLVLVACSLVLSRHIQDACGEARTKEV